MNGRYTAKKRDTRNRKRKKLMLIATEGKNKTEVNYFRSLQSNELKIVFARGNESDPVNMAEHLVQDYEHFGLSKDLGDTAFCVVDGDLSKTKEEQILAADKIVEGTGEIIVSNPCIEVWFLCHFTDSSKRYTSSKAVIRRLQEYIPSYEKNANGIYEMLASNISVAIENAKTLEKQHKQSGYKLHTSEFQPSSEIYKMIKKGVIDDET